MELGFYLYIIFSKIKYNHFLKFRAHWHTITETEVQDKTYCLIFKSQFDYVLQGQVHVAIKLPQIAFIKIHAYINKFYQYQTLQILQNQNFIWMVHVYGTNPMEVVAVFLSFHSNPLDGDRTSQPASRNRWYCHSRLVAGGCVDRSSPPPSQHKLRSSFEGPPPRSSDGVWTRWLVAPLTE